MEIKTDRLTGKAVSARVCAHCQKERGESQFLASYMKLLKIDNEVSHGICIPHYQNELAKLKID